MIAYSWMVALGLMLCFSARYTIGNDAKECIIGCRRKVQDDALCAKTCQSLKDLATNETQAPLLPPGIPTNVSSAFKSIHLTWNTTNKSNPSELWYIVEIHPNWANQSDTVVFPYLKKYYNTNKTDYTVENLLAKMSYKFRVVAVTLNETSSFSNWSSVIPTNHTCQNNPCTVTNVRLELVLFTPDKKMTDLNVILRWQPTTGLGTIRNRKSYVAVHVLSKGGYCRSKFNYDIYEKNGKQLKELTHRNFSFREILGKEFHLGCNYKIEIGMKDRFGDELEIAKWTRDFYIPRCVSGVCGCKHVSENRSVIYRFVNINLTRTSTNTSVITVTWNDDMWRNDINVTTFGVFLTYHINGYPQKIGPVYKDYKKDIHEYNVKFFNLTSLPKYEIQVIAHHGDHCRDSKRLRLDFKVRYPCANNNPCSGNKSCHRDGWLGNHKCKCDKTGYIEVNGTCQKQDFCRNHTCGPNSTCRSEILKGRFQCDCNDGLIKVNGTCLETCEAQPNAKGCYQKPGNEDTKSPNNTGIIVAAVVSPLVFIIIVALLLFYYLQWYHKKRLHTVTMDFQNRTETLNWPHAYKLRKDNTERELNVLYVPTEIKDAIAEGLTNGLYELSSNQLTLGKVIGKGAFGEVYKGEATGIMENPGQTTVAVKKLSDSATVEEIYDFLSEIKLMKTLEKHENVIEMYGCCTQKLPICLVMEFASGGNLLQYLRSLRRKCEKTALQRIDSGTQDTSGSEKKFEKFFKPDEMPTEIEAQAKNMDIAAMVNQEIETALNPKELESFARQIANGMTHVADQGIIHRDLAARNILLDGNNVLKISDFGLSREGIYVKKTGGKIPLRWLSIEAIQERRYSTSSDVWAFGIILWEICTLGDIPYPSVSDKDIFNFLVSGRRMRKAASCTDEIYEMMLKCWSHRPEDRPTFTEVSKFLWQLEHEGNNYVNIEPLMILSSSQPASEADDSMDDIDQGDYPNLSRDPESSSNASPSGFYNQAFQRSMKI